MRFIKFPCYKNVMYKLKFYTLMLLGSHRKKNWRYTNTGVKLMANVYKKVVHQSK